MGICIVCGCETTDFRCFVREENGKKYDDFQCEKCTLEKVHRERKEYVVKFNEKVLPYLLENNFNVVVREVGVDGKEIIEKFPVKDCDVMYCVDIIRNRMKEKGYYENWIDLHWEEYGGIDLEIVDYLCYSLPEDKDGETWVSYSLELIGANGLKLKRVSN